ncbi:MAG: OmpA family protein [Paludibacteraceae bacterium]|nr:OmpA family protein [Paludibacteraceae bacterium]
MADKVLVNGFNKYRTVEGILNSYTLIHPNCTIADINRAFPSSCHQSGKSILGTSKSATAGSKTSTIVDDYEKISIKTKDGKSAYLLTLWSDEDFRKIVNKAKQYDITIKSFKKRVYFVPGSYSITYLNGWRPGKGAPKPNTARRKAAKGFSWLLLLALLLLGLLLALLLMHLKEEKKEVVQEVEEVETQFNAVNFEKAKYNLSPDAKAVLDKLAAVMKSHEKFTLRIEGHTSKEGTVDYNQTLSENRARATYEYLLFKGVPNDRISYEGMGSSHPIDENNLAPNRRTEFIISDGKFTFRGLWEDLVKFVKSFF